MPDLRRFLVAPRLLRASLLGLVLLAAVHAAATADSLSIRILSPKNTDAVIGPTEISMRVTAQQGVTVLKVEVFVDDRLVTTLLDPPYRYRWDPGDTVRGHRIRAKAFASDGTQASHTVATQMLRGIERANVTLVEVYATVRDSGGRYRTDLEREDFTVFESGVPQKIAVFSAERKPVHLVLLFDSSASMGRDGKLELAQEAATGFVEELEPDDTAALVTFDDVARILHERSSDKGSLIAAIDSIEASGGTALYDAINTSVGLLKGIEGRKAIILISDGRDESASGLGPGSLATYEEALESVLVSEIAVYSIGTGARLEEEMDYYHRRTVGEILEGLSGASGGRAWFTKKASKLKSAYRKVEDELRHQYTLAYYPPAEAPPAPANDARGEGWRPIEVKVSVPRMRVTARSGYYAR